MNTDGTGFHTCKECHKTESVWNHTATDRKEEEQLEDRRSVGESSCDCGDGTDQRVQSLMFMVMMINMYVDCSGMGYALSFYGELFWSVFGIYIVDFLWAVSECRLQFPSETSQFGYQCLTLWRLTTHIGVVPHRYAIKLHFIYLFNKYRYWII